MRILIAGNQTLNIGKMGEHEALRVQFPISDWLKDFGNGVFQLLHKRNRDVEAQPVVVTSDSEYAYWLVSRSDVAYDGIGYCELVLIVNSSVAKSQTWTTWVDPSISPDNETPPDPFKSWVDDVLQAGSGVGESARQAKLAEQEAKAAADVALDASEKAVSASTTANVASASAGESAANAEKAALAAQSAANRVAYATFELSESGDLVINNSESLGSTTFSWNDTGDSAADI